MTRATKKHKSHKKILLCLLCFFVAEVQWQMKSPLELLQAGLLINPGDFLLSHAVSRAVPSAPAGLTSVFGMGTGVTLPTKSPENF